MKIICITQVNSGTSFYLRPDTALLRNSESFYVPDNSAIKYHCAAVVKITRLTKAIEQRFAGRCYEEVGFSVNFYNEKALSSDKPWDMAVGFDKSFAVSPLFLPFESVGQELNYSVEVNGQRSEGSSLIMDIDEAISEVSQYMTLKIGDYISIPFHAEARDATIGDVIKGFLNEVKLIEFNVK